MAEDYSALDNAALRRRIAERLGWHEVENPGTPGLSDKLAFHVDGETITIGELPNWPEDANAAFALLDKNVTGISLLPIGGGWMATLDINHFQQYGQAAFKKPVDTPARAICLSWLAWKDATDGT